MMDPHPSDDGFNSRHRLTNRSLFYTLGKLEKKLPKIDITKTFIYVKTICFNFMRDMCRTLSFQDAVASWRDA